MLKVINLYIIDKIFENTQKNLSAQARYLYIGSLMKHFKNKEASFENSHAFELTESDLEYRAFSKHYNELEKANLITVMLPLIRFENAWGQLIDRTKLNTVTAKTIFKTTAAKEFSEALLVRDSLHELCAMKYNITKSQTVALIKEFIKTQSAFEHPYMSEVECAKHAFYWIGKNVKKAPAGEVVKSKAKIIGR